MREQKLLRRVRWLIAFMIFGLVVSGVTAIPIETELVWLTRTLGADVGGADAAGGIPAWLIRARDAVIAVNRDHPFLFYGMDWLAFAHFLIAIAFLGPLRDPVRNSWVVTFGLIACAGVPVLAFTAGPARGIPFPWLLIDSSFGVAAAVPLLLCRRWIRELERLGDRRGAAVAP